MPRLSLLLSHQWKAFIRDPAWRGLSVAYTVFLGLLVLCLLFFLVLTGAFIGAMLTRHDPTADVVGLVNQHLLNTFFFLFVIRFLFQNTPQIKMQPYLHLPISRSRLVRFFSLAALFHLHNLLPLAFFMPFWFVNLARDYSAFAALSWLAGIAAMLGLSNYLVLCVRSDSTRRAWPVWLVGSGLIAVDYWRGWGYAGALSSAVFDSLLAPGGPVLALILLAATYLLFRWTCRLSKDHLLDEASGAKGPAAQSHGLLNRLANWGPVGQLMVLEIKLAIRNKRPRQGLWAALILLPVGLLGFIRPAFLGPPEPSTSSFMLMLWGFLLSCGYLLHHGPFMFAWEGRYFDGHLARPSDFRHLLWAKLLLLQASCLAIALACLPFLLVWGVERLPLYSAFLLYNMGINSAWVLFFAAMNRKHLDLTPSSLSQQGTALHHLLIIIPLLAPPVLLLLNSNLLVLAGGGLLGWALSPAWVGLLAQRLQKGKYQMAGGFRGSS